MLTTRVDEIGGIRRSPFWNSRRSGFCVTQKEADQARDYAKEIRKARRVQPTTEIVAYVLGATLEERFAIDPDYGEKTPRSFRWCTRTVLRKAHR